MKQLDSIRAAEPRTRIPARAGLISAVVTAGDVAQRARQLVVQERIEIADRLT